MEQISRRYICGTCGVTTSDYGGADDEEEDFFLPPGWMESRNRRRVPNPHYEEPSDVETLLETMVAGIPGPVEQHAVLRQVFRPMAESQAQREAESAPPRYIIDEVYTHQCPEHADGVVALDAEAWVE